MADTRVYTTQLQAGLGMIHESLDLLRLWDPNDTTAKLSEKAVASGVFSRTTARRSRNIVREMFAPRFLSNGAKAASYLKQLAESRHNSEDLTQLFFLYTARAQAVFAEFVTDVYWPKYSAGSHALARQDAQSFVQRALDIGKTQKRWTEATVRRVSGYLLGCCADFGLIETESRTHRNIKRFSIRPRVALYLAHDLHFSGLSDLSVVRHPEWRLFGLEANEVLTQIKNLAHDGHFIVQATTDLVHIAWKYASMEDCVRAISQG
jgi:hypothetical protein